MCQRLKGKSGFYNVAVCWEFPIYADWTTRQDLQNNEQIKDNSDCCVWVSGTSNKGIFRLGKGFMEHIDISSFCKWLGRVSFVPEKVPTVHAHRLPLRHQRALSVLPFHRWSSQGLGKQGTGLKSHSSWARVLISPKVLGLEGRCSSHSTPAVSCSLCRWHFLHVESSEKIPVTFWNFMTKNWMSSKA